MSRVTGDDVEGVRVAAESGRSASGVGWRPVVLGVAAFMGAAGATLLLWARGYPFPDLSRAYAVVFGWAGVVGASGCLFWAARLPRDQASPERVLVAWFLSALAVLVGMTGGWWVAQEALVAHTTAPHTAVDEGGPSAPRPMTGPIGGEKTVVP